jgi:transposase
MDKPKQIEITPEELESLLKRAEGVLDPGDYELIKGMAETIAYLSRAVEDKSISAKRLLEMLFSKSTEKTKKILQKLKKASSEEEASAADPDSTKKRFGHGRNGASAYTGGNRIEVPHKDLKTGDPCPKCKKGKVYQVKKPSMVIRVKGQAPLTAEVYELEKFRCNLCGASFTAPLPEEVGEEKYDEGAGSMIALLKYGSGLPFNRLQALQACLGVPLPSSTQWDIVEGVANRIYAAFDELKSQAAQGEIVHNDDTVMKVLTLMKENEEKKKAKGQSKKKGRAGRTGIFTSGVVSILEGRKMAVFFKGRKHSGENLADLMTKRNSKSRPPIQMCDALSRNTPDAFKTIVANCLAHGRRQFVDVAEDFPEECIHVLQTLEAVYKNDAMAKEKKMSADERLKFHQAQSEPLMKKLHEWFTRQFEEKKVESNSGLGKAFKYMLKHWKKLTLFLTTPGAPLDNNICERALKKTIQHRKNSLFYKTEHGAYIGDLFMSLIHTCSLCGANPFDYLIQLQKHSDELR